MSATSGKLPAWHEGERFLQEKVGVADEMAAVGPRAVRDHMPEQHRDFYAKLPFILVGSVDKKGDPWSTVLVGKPGFMSSPTPKILDIAAKADPGDPAGEGLREGASVGLLGIEMHTRRRNRMNGIVALTGTGFRVEVDQSFGNCPRYIQLRDFDFARDPAEPFRPVIEDLSHLDSSARAMIGAADAFFVATYADRENRRQVDVSHRGGRTGFVHLAEDGTLTVPDFNGNLFFSTLGNIVLNGRAGLLFIDYQTGDMLQMTGEAEVILDSPAIAAFQGAERLWTFRPRRILRRAGALALRWSFREDGWSPASLMTGDWVQAAVRLRGAERANRWRPYKVTKIVDESPSIRSFHLFPDDGAGLPPHAAGQYLPIRVRLSGSDKPVIRAYSLSVAPSDGLYRISVKRDGAVSCHLHEVVGVGDVIEARAPDGQFTIDPDETRPAVLLAGGIGITPLLAMLRHVVYEGLRRQRMRPVILVQAAHAKADRPFDREIDELVDAAQGAVKVIRVLSDPRGAKKGVDYDASGRVDMALLSRVLPFDDYDVYLCGPSSFIEALYDGLRDDGVADTRIHVEAFGPSSLTHIADAGAAKAVGAPPSTRPVPVLFMDALKEARWTPESGTLLELAEARGLEPDFNCREGKCGTCRTRLLKGAVSYLKEPVARLADDEVLICCAVPAEQGSDEENSIHLAL